ncbi:chemotaxis protein CheR [Skermanella stibiiresistens SB22]|uniref:Chemotaxis protein methyltransferase n=1 Tax=Skermanella stibiiresistens SB22 TaxID=1385369 RepID=W9HCP0_9PROT|nr:protein-glutamate O-methyltransferase [Skermanella stibiiresistens]EWY41628.1 chemotaxis protein CheR [Skermanella stibiiresistens SB22]
MAPNPYGDRPKVDRLGTDDYGRLADIFQSYTGIQLPPGKLTMIEGRLRKRVRVLGFDGIVEYCDYLFQHGGLDAEFDHLVDAVTTNKTDFFREPDHFRYLCDQAVPALLADRRASDRKLKLWSAACSTGAEAYTMAMTLADLFRRIGNRNVAILGTDICGEVLEQAVAAIYPDDMLAQIPAGMRRYVMRARDPNRREFRVVPELRRMARFQRLNLMDRDYPVDADIDVIFCRNVLIYFDKPTQRAVVERLSRHLQPGGFLFLGHSESTVGLGLDLVQIAPTIFRRR